MNVCGHKIQAGVERAIEHRMLHGGPFTATSLATVAHMLGVPTMSRDTYDAVAHRFIGRMIQRERKAGRITRTRRGWIAT